MSVAATPTTGVRRGADSAASHGQDVIFRHSARKVERLAVSSAARGGATDPTLPTVQQTLPARPVTLPIVSPVALPHRAQVDVPVSRQQSEPGRQVAGGQASQLAELEAFAELLVQLPPGLVDGSSHGVPPAPSRP
jgi:hypothetical protein